MASRCRPAAQTATKSLVGVVVVVRLLVVVGGRCDCSFVSGIGGVSLSLSSVEAEVSGCMVCGFWTDGGFLTSSRFRRG